MKPHELAAQCIRAMASQGEKPVVTITLPKGWKAPKGFPRRTLLSVNQAGGRNYHIRADRLLSWLTANGLVKVQ